MQSSVSRTRQPIPVPDPRRPFVLDIRALGRRSGSMLAGTITVPARERLGLDVVHVAADAPITLGLRLESVLDGVLVTGEVSAPQSGECARCLEPITAELETGFTELWCYPEQGERCARHAEPGSEQDDEVYQLAGDRLDLEPAVRDAIVLSLPIQPLCRADCRGLCVECGERWDDLPGEHSHERPDPRWGALRDLTVSTAPVPTRSTDRSSTDRSQED